MIDEAKIYIEAYLDEHKQVLFDLFKHLELYCVRIYATHSKYNSLEGRKHTAHIFYRHKDPHNELFHVWIQDHKDLNTENNILFNIDLRLFEDSKDYYDTYLFCCEKILEIAREYLHGLRKRVYDFIQNNENKTYYHIIKTNRKKEVL